MSAEWQFLVTLNEHLRPLRDPIKVQDVALRLLGEHLGNCNVRYTLIEGDEFILARVHDRRAVVCQSRAAHDVRDNPS